MKTIYIPKGTTNRYKSLYADRLIVDGCLYVDQTLDARSIGGKGTIHAGKVSADIIRINFLEAALVMCRRLLAVRVDAPEVFASERVVVSGFLSACSVKCPKLIVALSSVEQLEVPDVTSVPARGMGVFTIQIFTALRTLWLSAVALIHHGSSPDADAKRKAPDPVADTTPPAPAAAEHCPSSPWPSSEEVDEELNRIVSLFKLSREHGYTLRLIPGTPEENAPVFDFDAANRNKAA